MNNMFKKSANFIPFLVFQFQQVQRHFSYHTNDLYTIKIGDLLLPKKRSVKSCSMEVFTRFISTKDLIHHLPLTT